MHYNKTSNFIYQTSSMISISEMEKPQSEIKVFSKCLYALHWMNLCRKTQLQVGGVKIPNIIIFTLLSIPLSNGVFGVIRLVFDIGFNFKNASFLFYSLFLFILGTSQMQIIYFCLVNNNELIIKLLDHIQDTVNRSNLHLIIFFYYFFSAQTKFKKNIFQFFKTFLKF